MNMITWSPSLVPKVSDWTPERDVSSMSNQGRPRDPSHYSGAFPVLSGSPSTLEDGGLCCCAELTEAAEHNKGLSSRPWTRMRNCPVSYLNIDLFFIAEKVYVVLLVALIDVERAGAHSFI